MAATEVTTMGERGQIVIPQSLRERLGLQKGEKFTIDARQQLLILQRLQLPPKVEIDRMFKQAHQHARKHRLTKKDMWDAIRKVRAMNLE